MSLGSDFTGGFQSGLAMRQQRQDKKKDELDRELRRRQLDDDLNNKTLDRELRVKALEQDAALQREGRTWQGGEADKDRTWRSGERTATQGFTAEQQQMDRELRQKALEQDAQQSAAQLGLARSELDARRPGMNAQTRVANAQANALGQQPPKNGPVEEVTFDPTGNVTDRKMRGPLGSLGQFAQPQAEPYRSPYGEAIGAAESEIAKQKIAMAGGDNRTGFLNMSSRQGVVDEQSRQLTRLKALDLQDRVQKGLMTQQQADEEAKRLMP